MQKVIDTLKNPQALSFEMRKRRKDVFFWIGGIIFILFIFYSISSKDYSFLLVLSALTQMLAFLIVLIKVYSYQNYSGLSINTLICYALLLVGRLSSTLGFYGYLPMDSTGDWFYQLTEIISLCVVILLIYLIVKCSHGTSDIANDTVSFYYLAVPALGLALIVHTSLNRFFLTDVLWTFSMYLEGVAVFPQIKLFVIKRKQIESFTSHYVSFCGLSRLLSLLFWWDTFQELNSHYSGSYSLFSNYCGYFIIASQILQLIIMADYYYLYFKSLFDGQEINMASI